MRVKNETEAASHFVSMIMNVDSTKIVTNVDGSVTAMLTDTLGNVKGTAEYVRGGTSGVLASVIFS